jgi:hypothetical protein
MMMFRSPIVEGQLFTVRYRPRIIEARVVKAFKEATPTRKASFFKVGVRIDLDDGSWWFVGRSGSWVCHFPVRQALDKFFRPLFDRHGVPVMAPEVKNRWDSVQQLKLDLGRRNPWLVIRLWNAFVSAQ